MRLRHLDEVFAVLTTKRKFGLTFLYFVCTFVLVYCLVTDAATASSTTSHRCRRRSSSCNSRSSSREKKKNNNNNNNNKDFISRVKLIKKFI